MPIEMTTRAELLAQIWNDLINAPMTKDAWIENVMANCRRRPNDPFADTGPVLERLLATGADRRDLSLLVRQAKYEAVFRTLYMLEDPGADDTSMLYEELLTADPSGMDGRPGSAPTPPSVVDR